MSLSKNRQFFLTASVAVTAMAGFEEELQLQGSTLPKFKESKNILSYIKENKLTKAPLVRELNSVGIKSSVLEIKDVYNYHKSLKKPFTEGMLTAAEKIAASHFIDYEDRDKSYKSASMRRGNTQELESMKYISSLSGFQFSNTGGNQIFTSKGDLGVTSDGLHYNNCFEISEACDVKNPDWNTHMKYLNRVIKGVDLLAIEPLYYWQGQTGIEVYDLKRYHWMSYHKGYNKIDKKYKCAYVEIERNDQHIEILKSRASRVIERSKQIIENITNR